MSRVAILRLGSAATIRWSALQQQQRQLAPSLQLYRPMTSSIILLPPQFNFPRHLSLPRILQPSLWKGLVPKSFREPRVAPAGVLATDAYGDPIVETKGSKPWNPTVVFMILLVFVGSQAMNMIALKNQRAVFARKADNRILALREVIRKVHEGVWKADGPEVEKVLRYGLDNEEITDKDWENALREIEEDEAAWQAVAKKRQQNWRENPPQFEEQKGSARTEASEPGKREAPSGPRSASDYFR